MVSYSLGLGIKKYVWGRKHPSFIAARIAMFDILIVSFRYCMPAFLFEVVSVAYMMLTKQLGLAPGAFTPAWQHKIAESACRDVASKTWSQADTLTQGGSADRPLFTRLEAATAPSGGFNKDKALSPLSFLSALGISLTDSP